MLERSEPDIDLAARLFDELLNETSDTSGVTRQSYGEGEQAAHEIVRREAERLDLEITTDAACNLYMTHRGTGAGPAIFIGSHLDSVPKGGNFDGAAGVLMGMSIVAGFRRAELRPERDITVMAIRAEESVWFEGSYIGSRAAFGKLAEKELDYFRRAGDDLPLGVAIQRAGGNPEALRLGEAHLEPVRIGVFIEPHIEQGPALVLAGKPVGIVTAIRGSFRYRNARCRGEYAHSGATPRVARKDAVAATAALVSELDELWVERESQGKDLTITFGQVTTNAEEHAFSKVAGEVDFCIDVRSQSPKTLDQVRIEIGERAARIARERNVSFDMGPLTGSESAHCDPSVIRRLDEACTDLGVDRAMLPCGAGHDAAVFAQMGVATGMLFIRNENGSHNPAEAMAMDDFAKAAKVLSRFCLQQATVSK